MKITKSKLRQIIKEEVQNEIFGFGKSKSKPEPAPQATPEPSKSQAEPELVSMSIVQRAPSAVKTIQLSDERAFPVMKLVGEYASGNRVVDGKKIESPISISKVFDKGYTQEGNLRKFYYKVPKGFLEITFKANK